MQIDITKLPNSVEALQAMIVEQLKALESKDKALESKDKRIDNLEFRVHQLDQVLKRYLNREYGRSTDQAPAVQTNSLFNEAEKEVGENPVPEDIADDEIHVPGHTRARGKRKPLPAELPRVEKIYDLTENEKICSDPECGCALKQIGTEASEQLDIIPAKVQVIVHKRKKYACPKCENGVKIASMPAQAIPKSMATAGTLAHVAICKFEDALPLHRQEKIFERIGVDLPRATMARWMIACGSLVKPLIDRIRLEILDGPVIHMDETPIQVLKEKDRKAWDKSYMWVMARGSPRGGPRAVIYNYNISRSQIVIEDLLAGYKGHVQSDEFSGYKLLDRMEGVTRLGCWAHVRRQFTDALKAAPRGGEGSVANHIVALIKKLYQIERDSKHLTRELIVACRREKSLPILIDIKDFADKHVADIPPKSLTGKALNYLLKAWDHLVSYVDCGDADIDNNYVERAIRPFTLGRKNWHFADTAGGAHASAALYSLVETAKANKIDPYQYLRDVFTKLPTMQSDESLDPLLPWNWKSELLA